MIQSEGYKSETLYLGGTNIMTETVEEKYPCPVIHCSGCNGTIIYNNFVETEKGEMVLDTGTGVFYVRNRTIGMERIYEDILKHFAIDICKWQCRCRNERDNKTVIYHVDFSGKAIQDYILTLLGKKRFVNGLTFGLWELEG